MSEGPGVVSPPPKKVRVLFVNTRSALGADVAVHLTLIQNFDPAEVEVHIATNRNSIDLENTLALLREVPHVRVRVCDLGREMGGMRGGKLGKMAGAPKNLGAAVTLMRLARYVRRHRIDILHSTDRPRDALLATLLAKMTGRRNILHIHIKWYPGIGRATKWALERCAGVLAISRFVRGSLMEGGVPAEKIYTALNATDTVLFDPANALRGLLRNRFGLTDETPLIGIVGRIMFWKGHHELIEAMPKVKAAFPNMRLAIIGKEDTHMGQGDDTYGANLRARITELGLDENVLWAGWQEDAAGVMTDLDLLAVPSWEEPFGLVVTEAMAMERPVVGYNTGALPEIITDGVEGLLVPPKDADAMAEALIALLRDPDRRKTMGQKGRARVLEAFTPRRQADEVTAIYRQVLRGVSQDQAHAEGQGAKIRTPAA